MNERNTQARAAFESVIDALARLDVAGCTVVAQIWTGRKPVIIVDKAPAFVRGALKSRQVAAHAVHRTYAAPFHGVQLEWMESAPIAQVVGHA